MGEGLELELVERVWTFLRDNRHGPSISLARIANGVEAPMADVMAALDKLEPDGRIRVTRYDNATWSYRAVEREQRQEARCPECGAMTRAPGLYCVNREACIARREDSRHEPTVEPVPESCGCTDRRGNRDCAIHHGLQQDDFEADGKQTRLAIKRDAYRRGVAAERARIAPLLEAAHDLRLISELIVGHVAPNTPEDLLKRYDAAEDAYDAALLQQGELQEGTP